MSERVDTAEDLLGAWLADAVQVSEDGPECRHCTHVLDNDGRGHPRKCPVPVVEEALGLLARSRVARPRSEWHEDYGDVLWWHLPVQEPPYVGSPLDDDWPDDDGWLTHWTPITCPLTVAEHPGGEGL